MPRAKAQNEGAGDGEAPEPLLGVVMPPLAEAGNKVRVRANVKVLGLRLGEEATRERDGEVSALLARGLLEEVW